MTLPSDPNILVSMINMKLRDGGFDSLADFCLSEGVDQTAIVTKLSEAGFEYNPENKQFR
ncbi:MAG: DUF4250 domain-containing protein [Muribaculaceae bacterium]|nr:DUF4250 domain-containing protein [Muribaculaceae bacterium]MDE6533420.1 DUF4250 domain-containing protein [Muribaculaceae bacterium]MDE6772663.1 DUF4250 domain-containing protein [Muribaculaceae bacterium]